MPMKPMRRLFTLLLSTMLPAFALAQSPAVVPAQELIQPELVQASSPTQWWNSARAQGATGRTRARPRRQRCSLERSAKGSRQPYAAWTDRRP